MPSTRHRDRPRTDRGRTPAPATGPHAVALQESLGFRLDRVQRTLRSGWAADLASLGLTPPLAAMLRGVRQHPGTSVRGLARLLGADAMTVKRGVDELETRQLVRTTTRVGDRRPRCLEVTRRGASVAARVDERARARESVFDTLTPELRRSFGDVLATLERALDLGDGPEAADPAVGRPVELDTRPGRKRP